MSISIYKNSEPHGSFNYYEDSEILIVGPGVFRVLNHDEGYGKFLDLTSDRQKIIVTFFGSPYHFYFDSLGYLFNGIDVDKDALFVLNTHVLKTNAPKPFMPFVEKLLDKLQIDYIEIDPSEYEYIKINNFYYKGIDTPPIPDPTQKIYGRLKEFSDRPESVPNKKVYISRAKADFIANENNNAKYNNLNYKNLNFAHPRIRIDEENKVEDFFREHGFEILYAEKFQSVEEQIGYMSEVKTMACISGSSFLNCLLMPDGGNFLEIVTPMTTPAYNGHDRNGPWIEAIHHFGSDISFHKNHNYYTVNNHKFNADAVIESIKNNKALMELINE